MSKLGSRGVLDLSTVINIWIDAWIDIVPLGHWITFININTTHFITTVADLIDEHG